MDEPRTAATPEAIGEQSDAQWNQTGVTLEILQQQSGHSNASKPAKRLRSVTTGVVHLGALMRLSVISATLGPLCEVDSLIQSIIRALQRADSAIGGLLERCDEVVDLAYGMGEAVMCLLSSRLEENAATDI